jgi:hypothetical protein
MNLTAGVAMPAKRTKKHSPELMSPFAAHVEASNKAYEWSSMAMEYRRAGDLARAQDAERRARDWLETALRIKERANSPLGERK